MKNKLELADIVGYLPYGLVIHKDGWSTSAFVTNVDLKLQTIRAESINNTSDRETILYTIKRNGYSIPFLSACNVKISSIKPILRPMSDLIKPMTHPDINDGEEFIPLVEIAKLLNPYSGTYELGKWNSDSNKGAWQENSVNKYSNGKHYESVKAFDECAYEYYYLTHFDENNYIQRQNREGYCENIMFPNVIKFLNKLHFDYNDLIGQGLAIDINTINQ